MKKELLFKDINIRDPFILPDGGKYYMYGTGGSVNFGENYGFGVYVSDDLVHWSEPKTVFEKKDGFWGTMNYWAPEVHKYGGRYYMFATFKSKTACRGTQILVCDRPEGEFVPLTDGPITPHDWECLDGTLYVDEKGKPYIVFCHEWLQVHDGEMCAMELTPDLKYAVGAPTLLFRASDPAWADKGKVDYVTDGPFFCKTSSGRPLMIWSSFANGNYVEAMAYPEDGNILGKWHHADKLLFEKDGGHGMVFDSYDGQKYFTYHCPNTASFERPALKKVKEVNGLLVIDE